MQSKIGLFSMILLCLNSIVGSGIFLLPGQVSAIVGSFGLIVYGLVALIVMAIAWCFVKCSSLYSRNGGAYLYAKEAFGDFIGFEIGIMRWASGMIAWASLTVGFVTALGALWPLAAEAPYKQTLIISMISGLGMLNLFGVSGVSRVNNLITVTKLLAVALFVGFGLFTMQSAHFIPSAESLPTIDKWGTAALLVFFAFSGFEALPVVAGEVKNPKKNIPRAVVISILVSCALYFILQIICMGALGPKLSSSLTPLSDVAQILMGTPGKFLISIATLISIGGVTIASSFITPRSCSAMAEDKMIFPKLVEQSRFGSPHYAIVISVLLTSVIALSGNFVQLVTISVVSRFAQHITTCLALYVFDKNAVMKPFDKPWKRGIPLFALLGIGWLLIHAEVYQLLCGLGALLLGIPLYFLQKRFSDSKISS